MKRELQYLYALIFMGLIGYIAPLRAQDTLKMDAHWTIKKNDGHQFSVELGIKTNTAHEHLGPAQFIFLFNSDFMSFNGGSTGPGSNPADYSWIDSFSPAIYPATSPGDTLGYATSSNVSQPTLGTIVISLDFIGPPGASISSISDYTPIIDINFTILDPSKSDSITWAMSEGGPPTFDNVEDDTYDYFDEGIFSRLDVSALPVNLIQFNAGIKNAVASISWSTASEINNDFFTIERGQHGDDFIPITQVKGSGNSESIKEYTTIDPDPLPGVSYYRLRQTDYNGDSQLFYMVAVNNKGGISPEIQELNVSASGGYPEISYSIIGESEIRLRITDINGKLILNRSVPSHPGTNKIDLHNIPALKPGMYIISLYSDDDVVYTKMAVQ